VGSEGALALASAKGWARLRSLRLPDLQLAHDDMRRFLASPNLSHLVWLSLGGNYRRGSSSLTITPKLAADMSRLPNLACLYLNVSTGDAQMRRMFSSTDSLSWVWIFSDDLGNDEKMFRAFWAPEHWPPMDDTWDLRFRERG